MVFRYTDVDAIQAELRATTDFSSATSPTLSQVEDWIIEESADINDMAGYAIGEEDYVDTINWDGSEILILKNSPIITVSSVYYTIYNLGTTDYALDNLAVEDTDYSIDTEKGILYILANRSANFKEGLKTIKVTYTAGEETTPYAVKKLATKKVTLRILNSLLASDMSEGNSGGSVSVGSISIVEPEEFGTKRYKSLSDDVEMLEKRIVQGNGVHRYINY